MSHLIFRIIILILVFNTYIFSQNISDGEIIKDCLWAKISNLPKEKRLPVGLVLSGGGARAFAHTGTLEVLNSISFPIDYISGSSMGSVIGGLYALGFSLPEIWNFAKVINKLNISKDFSKIKVLNLILTEKLIKPIYIRKFIDEKFKDKTIDEFKIPFGCAAMDIKTGEKIIFLNGPAAIAIKASVNLPGIFEPIKYKHRYLVDGGVVDFLPVDIVKHMGAKWIISSITETELNEIPDNVLTTLMQVIDIRGSLLAQKSKEESDFIINPDVSYIGVADFQKCIEAANKALKETNKNIENIIKKYIIDNIQRNADVI